MTAVEITARARVGSGVPVERLICHPRRPLVAGLDSERPAVHVWECGAGSLRELGTVGAGTASYHDAIAAERMPRRPGVAWHPYQPLLLVAGEAGVMRWTPTGCAEWEGLPPTAAYEDLAFSPDGQTLWASPSSTDAPGRGYGASDALDLASGHVSTGPGWDTGVAAHPSGELVVTLCSDQGATLGLFARIDQRSTPTVMRVLRRALILVADGYETPIFSADGRHLAIRGNAYDNWLEVFEFPSLRRVLATTLDEPDPDPDHPDPQEWRERMRPWLRHDIAFGAQPGVLWVGTPTGVLLEVDLYDQQVVRHEVLAGTPVTGLGTTAAGELVVAGGAGELALASVLPDATSTSVDQDGSRAAAASFLETAPVVPDDGDLLEDHLVITDGVDTWEADDLAVVTSATETDPIWLQRQAALNNAAGAQPR